MRSPPPADSARSTGDDVPSSPVPSAPTVSVVIPCYRHAHVLADALTSVREQGSVVHEVIVVDDGSPDDVSTVVARFPGVQLVQQANSGPAAARNAGLQRTTGEFVAFLDADDVWFPGALVHGVAALRAHPGRAFAAGAFVERRTDTGAVLGRHSPGLDAPNARPGVIRDARTLARDEQWVRQAQYAAMLRGNFIGMHGAVLYRRTALLAIGGFRAEVDLCEDWDVYLRLLNRGPAALHEATVAEYRRHGENTSYNTARMFVGARRVLRAQRAHVGTHPALQRAIADGFAGIRGSYGGSLMERLRGRTADPRGLGAVAGAFAVLLRHDPAFVLRRLVWYGLRGGRLPAKVERRSSHTEIG